MKSVLITGAYGGMGIETCKAFLLKGYKVFALDYKINSKIDGVYPIACDITKENEIIKAFKTISKEVTSLDRIVHLAGVYMLDSLVEISEERFKNIFNINVFGVYRINKIFLPLLHKGSRIIITTSELANLDPLPFTGIYAISKSSLDKYAYSLRMELQLLNIDVTTLRAGAVKTPLLNDSTDELDKFVASTKLYSCNAKRFKNIVDSVEAKAINSKKLANKIIKISNKKHSKFSYKINNNFLLKILSILPKKLQFFIIKKILK